MCQGCGDTGTFGIIATPMSIIPLSEARMTSVHSAPLPLIPDGQTVKAEYGVQISRNTKE